MAGGWSFKRKKQALLQHLGVVHPARVGWSSEEQSSTMYIAQVLTTRGIAKILKQTFKHLKVNVVGQCKWQLYGV